jgi:hypothetical protein
MKAVFKNTHLILNDGLVGIGGYQTRNDAGAYKRIDDRL